MNRGNESPMDFEWQTHHGPADVTSPFHKFAMENQRKRPHSIFDSPQKASAPTLREPNSQPFLFSQAPPANPPPVSAPWRAPSFTTPRKPMEIEFSSGPENMSSPEQADNEDTPDHSRTTVFSANDGKPKNKRNSLFNFYGRFAPSPGRGEIPRAKYSDLVARRVHKKRRRAQLDRQLILGRRTSDDTSEEDDHQDQRAAPRQPEDVTWVASLFAFIERYPNAPALITKYVQVLFNMTLTLGIVYALYSILRALNADLSAAHDEAAAVLSAERSACAKNFVENRCGSDRAPALEATCNNWEICMHRDPNAVRTAKVGIQAYAEILNAFVEALSLKTMIVTSFVIFTTFWASNRTFSRVRSNLQSTPTPPAADQQWATEARAGGWNGQGALEYSKSPRKTSQGRARSRSPHKAHTIGAR